MDLKIQTKCYELIEKLMKGGCTLPISNERAESILKMQEPATREDLIVLRDAAGKGR